MSPAEKRIHELIERWLASLEAHKEYAALDDEAYWRARKWVKHERPTRWIIDLAHQKTVELKSIVDSSKGDAARELAEALELMAMLANLVGAQNLQRFIPLADIKEKPAESEPATDDTQRQRIPPGLKDTAGQDPTPSTRGTPEVRRVANGDEGPAPVPGRRSHRAHARTATRQRASNSEADRAAPTANKVEPAGAPSAIETGVMGDAVRLLKWGRSWHELPDAIVRMSGRPPMDVVRQILRKRRTEIEARAATSE